MEKNFASIEIPLDVLKKIEKRIEKTEFKSVSEKGGLDLALNERPRPGARPKDEVQILRQNE